jgi:hypothetical protein
MVCCLLGAACGALALANGRAARAAGKGLKGVAVLGVMALRCDGLMAVLGVTHHTGQVPAWGRGGQGGMTCKERCHLLLGVQCIGGLTWLPARLPACRVFGRG